MAAYASVASLIQILEEFIWKEKMIRHDAKQIEFLREKMVLFRDKVFMAPLPRNRETVDLEERIRDAAQAAKNKIESYISNERIRGWFTFCPIFNDWDQVRHDLDSIQDAVMNADVLVGCNEHFVELKDQHADKNADVLAGFHDDFQKLKELLLCGSSSLHQIIVLTGIGGSGKTTLVKRLYHDDAIEHYFEKRAWVSLARNHNIRDVLVAILASLGELTNERRHMSEGELSVILYQYLFRRRYLIVFDNKCPVLDDLNWLFPNLKDCGSRIISTSRYPPAAAAKANTHIHEMRPLREQESWGLLCQIVLGEELSTIGRRIVKHCKGLPRAVAEIGRRLAQNPSSPSNWEKSELVAEGMGMGCNEDFEELENLHDAKNDVFQEVKELLLGGSSSQRQTIVLTGIRGSGKTTLAKRLYHDDDTIARYFGKRAWVSLARNHTVRDILVGILDSFGIVTDERRQESEGELSKILHQYLNETRYLIVLDNMCNASGIDWADLMRRLLLDNDNGSRIFVTTRDHPPVDASADIRKMRPFTEEESWDLLGQILFGEELSSVGRRIVQRCSGLPLTVAVIGGHLAQKPWTRINWEKFSKDYDSSIVNPYEEPTLRIIFLTYVEMPSPLKACFLYLGLFPEDEEIPTSKLIKHWLAEGFLESHDGRVPEEVAQGYLNDLISRNLVMPFEEGFYGKTKATIMHDLIREFCVREARRDKFLSTKSITVNKSDHPGHTCSPRLRVQYFCDRLPTGIFGSSDDQFHFLRTLLYSGPPCTDASHEYCQRQLLRLLDMAQVDIGNNVKKFKALVHMRYLEFACTREIHIPKELPDQLWFLQTLIISQRTDINGRIRGSVHLPASIGKMTQLRHLQFGKAIIPPPDNDLNNLHTLWGVSSTSCKEGLFKRIPNLKKLVVRVDAPDFSLSCLLVLTDNLEILKCLGEPGQSSLSIPESLSLPPTLKRLTLNTTGFAWKDMSIIGRLPTLQVLKLCNFSFHGGEWETKEEEFRELQYLSIDWTDLKNWRVYDKTHFPKLRKLVLLECYYLKEIPAAIGEVDTMELIELDDASDYAVRSAKQIEEDSRDYDDALKVRVFYIRETVLKDKVRGLL